MNLQNGKSRKSSLRSRTNLLNLGKTLKVTCFGEALKSGFYDLQNARENYILACGSCGMNGDLIFRFMDVQTRLEYVRIMENLFRGRS